ncbi:MAG: (d)CMP kinase [Acidimicrobiales bacterium]
MNSQKIPLIAIDGPAGSGKSTIARAVAARLGLERLDTGSMYRAVALLVLRAGAELSDGERAAELARSMRVELGDRVLLDGEDVTAAIRSPDVDSVVSTVSAHPAVRAELVERQREWGRSHGGGVVEGRDIGTVVFPHADLKIYLTADPIERARRRVDQRAGGDVDGAKRGFEAVAELARRDASDSGRALSPLQVARDAIVVDSTGLSVDDVIEEVLSHL